jgi:type II secretory pathway component PulK
MMQKKAQSLIITLWTLIILTILAVSIAHRVSFSLRTSNFHKNKLKAQYFAHAGLNRAIREIDNDLTPDCDSLVESWANNKEVFEKISLDQNSSGFSSVSYQNFSNQENITVFGVRDEERSININTASRELLLSLFNDCQIPLASDLIDNILIWRGDKADENKIYEKEGYACKAEKFSALEELLLVKDFTPEHLDKLKNYITIYGNSPTDTININTVSLETLKIFCRYVARTLAEPLADGYADTIASKIVELRDTQGAFLDKDGIGITLSGDEETNIFNSLIEKIQFKSDFFLIEVTGNTGTIKSTVAAVYNREEKKIISLHES